MIHPSRWSPEILVCLLKLPNSNQREVSGQFSSNVPDQKASYEWSYVVSLKARELAHQIVGKRKLIDFSCPEPNLKREDTYELREKILTMPYSEWKKMGYSKGTLHYLKLNAKEDKPFKICGKNRNRVLLNGLLR